MTILTRIDGLAALVSGASTASVNVSFSQVTFASVPELPDAPGIFIEHAANTLRATPPESSAGSAAEYQTTHLLIVQ